MPVYEYKGVHYDLPDGLSNEQALGKIKSHLGETTEAPAKTPATVSDIMSKDIPEWGLERAKAMLGQEFGLGGRLAALTKGAFIDPALGIAQLATGYQSDTLNKFVQDYEQQFKEAQNAQGTNSFVPQLVGAVASPVNKLLPAVQGATAAAKAASAVRSGAVAGALQPVTGSDITGEKMLQVGGGAALGGGLGVLLPTAAKLISAVKDLPVTAANKTKAIYEHLSKLGAGDEEIIAALKSAQEIVPGSKATVAEAVADISKAAPLAAYQKSVEKTAEGGGTFLERTRQNIAARLRAAQTISGTESERQMLERIRSTGESTIGAKEAALTLADTAGEAAKNVEGSVRKEMSALMEAGDPAEVAKAFAQKQLTDLEAKGVFAVKAQPIIEQLDGIANNANNDLTKVAVRAVVDKLKAKTDVNGIISSRDLYENFRKMTNQEIASWLNLGEQFASGGVPQQVAKALSGIRPAVDRALNISSRGLWGKYLTNYKAYSDKLDRMEIGKQLVDKLSTPMNHESAGAFATAVENVAATVKTATGRPRVEDLGTVLSSKEMETINRIRADLSRQDKAKELAAQVGAGESAVKGTSLPPTLNQSLTMLKAAYAYLQRGNKAAFNTKMTELLANPADLATFMTSFKAKNVAQQESALNTALSAIYKNLTESNRNALVKAYELSTQK